MLKRVLIGVAVVAALGTLVGVSLKGGRRNKGPRVYMEEAARRNIVRVVKATGEIDPRLKVNISSHVIGKIEKLYVEEGDTIERGQPFLELEKEAFRAVRDSARAQLSIAKTQFRQAEINLEDGQLKVERARRLAKELITATADLEAAELDYRSRELAVEQAREAVLQAQAALDKAEDDLRKTTIYAPLSGRVVSLSAEEGEVVVSGTMNNPASVIGVIADLSEILAEVDVDETEVAFLALDQTASLEVDALPDREMTGHIVEIGSSGFERPQQPDVTFFKAKILLDHPDEELRPGMSVRAEINTAEHADAVVVPVQAVVQRPPLEKKAEENAAGDGAEGAEEPEGEQTAEAAETTEAAASDEAEEIDVVFVVEDEVVHQRPVETGLSDTTHIEIVSGLEQGEKVVTGPYRVLKDLDDGDQVRERKPLGEGEQEEGEEDD